MKFLLLFLLLVALWCYASAKPKEYPGPIRAVEKRTSIVDPYIESACRQECGYSNVQCYWACVHKWQDDPHWQWKQILREKRGVCEDKCAGDNDANCVAKCKADLDQWHEIARRSSYHTTLDWTCQNECQKKVDLFNVDGVKTVEEYNKRVEEQNKNFSSCIHKCKADHGQRHEIARRRAIEKRILNVTQRIEYGCQLECGNSNECFNFCVREMEKDEYWLKCERHCNDGDDKCIAKCKADLGQGHEIARRHAVEKRTSIVDPNIEKECDEECGAWLDLCSDFCVREWQENPASQNRRKMRLQECKDKCAENDTNCIGKCKANFGFRTWMGRSFSDQ